MNRLVALLAEATKDRRPEAKLEETLQFLEEISIRQAGGRSLIAHVQNAEPEELEKAKWLIIAKLKAMPDFQFEPEHEFTLRFDVAYPGQPSQAPRTMGEIAAVLREVADVLDRPKLKDPRQAARIPRSGDHLAVWGNRANPIGSWKVDRK